jgi:hypothetical protein
MPTIILNGKVMARLLLTHPANIPNTKNSMAGSNRMFMMVLFG